MWNEDEDEDEEEDATFVRPAHTTETLRGEDVPTEASETVHQSIYQHYVFYHLFYHKKHVLYVFLEYRTFGPFESPSAVAHLSPTDQSAVTEGNGVRTKMMRKPTQ